MGRSLPPRDGPPPQPCRWPSRYPCPVPSPRSSAPDGSGNRFPVTDPHWPRANPPGVPRPTCSHPYRYPPPVPRPAGRAHARPAPGQPAPSVRSRLRRAPVARGPPLRRRGDGLLEGDAVTKALRSMPARSSPESRTPGTSDTDRSRTCVHVHNAVSPSRLPLEGANPVEERIKLALLREGRKE